MEKQEFLQQPPPYNAPVHYAASPAPGQQVVNVSPCPSPSPQHQVYAPQVYAPVPQQQVVNVSQPTGGSAMTSSAAQLKSR